MITLRNAFACFVAAAFATCIGASTAVAAPAWVVAPNLSSAAQGTQQATPFVMTSDAGESGVYWANAGLPTGWSLFAGRQPGAAFGATQFIQQGSQLPPRADCTVYSCSSPADGGFDAAGNLYLFLTGNNDAAATTAHPQVATRLAGSGTFTVTDVDTSQVGLGTVGAVNASGRQVVAYVQASDNKIHVSERTGSGAWTELPPLVVATGPQLSINARGDVLLTYTVGSGIIHAAFKPAGGAFTDATLSTASAAGGIGNSYQGQALDDAGNATVIWVSDPGATFTEVVKYAQLPFGGVWAPAAGNPAQVISGNVDISPAYPTSIDVSPGGYRTIAFAELDAGTPHIKVRESAANAAFSATTALAASSSTQPNVDYGTNGHAVVVWKDNAAGKLAGAYRSAGPGAWLAMPTTGAPTSGEPRVATDGFGNGVVGWQTGNDTMHVAGLDLSGPSLASATIAASGTAGQAVAFSAAPTDVWSAVASTSWSFSDGTTANTASGSHTFAAAGSYTATASSTDGNGNVSVRAFPVTIAAPAGGTPGGDTPSGGTPGGDTPSAGTPAVVAPVVTPPVVGPPIPVDTTPRSVGATAKRPGMTLVMPATGIVDIGTLTCGTGELFCNATATLTSTRKIKLTRRGKPARYTFGSVKLRVVGSKTGATKVRLSKAEQALVNRLGSVPVTTTIVVEDSSGNARTLTVTFVLKAQPKKH